MQPADVLRAPMDFLKRYLGLEGRINRAQYATLLVLAWLVPFIALKLTETTLHEMGNAGVAIAVGLLASTLWAWFSATIRRFHDMNKSAWACLLILVPVIGQLTPLALLFCPGDNYKNNYGSPPIWF